MAQRYCRIDGIRGCPNPLHNFGREYDPGDVVIGCYRCGATWDGLRRILFATPPEEIVCWCQVDKASTLRHMAEMGKEADAWAAPDPIRGAGLNIRRE